MWIIVVKSFVFTILLSVAGCAFAVPDENPITPDSVTKFNSGYPSLTSSRIAFVPEFPNPVQKEHVLYQAVSIGEIEAVPEVIRNINIAVASSAQFEEALRITLANSNLLSESADTTTHILDVRYVKNDFFALTTVIHYQLRKKGVPTLLLDRDISSKVIVENLWGGMTWSHARTATRLAHTKNISSVTWCLEMYDGETFPVNCNLEYANLDN